MKKQYLVFNKRVIFSKGPIRLIDCKIRTPHGRILSRQVLEHPGCVAIIPRTAAGKYILVRQYRFPLEKYLWEFPAGGREPGETLLHAANRELAEEIGMKPGKLKKLLAFYPTPGVSAEKMHLYLAWNLLPKIAEKDEDEEFEVKAFRLDEIRAMIARGQIDDGKTILAYLCLQKCRKGTQK